MGGSVANTLRWFGAYQINRISLKEDSAKRSQSTRRSKKKIPDDNKREEKTGEAKKFQHRFKIIIYRDKEHYFNLSFNGLFYNFINAVIIFLFFSSFFVKSLL